LRESKSRKFDEKMGFVLTRFVKPSDEQMKYNEILTFYKSFNQSQYIQSSVKIVVLGWKIL
jgi:hypothetical protein